MEQFLRKSMERFQEGYLEQIIEESLKAFQKGTLGKFPKKFTDEVWKQSMQDFHQESKKKFFFEGMTRKLWKIFSRSPGWFFLGISRGIEKIEQFLGAIYKETLREISKKKHLIVEFLKQLWKTFLKKSSKTSK